jgi:hypothetical protein
VIAFTIHARNLPLEQLVAELALACSVWREVSELPLGEERDLHVERVGKVALAWLAELDRRVSQATTDISKARA